MNRTFTKLLVLALLFITTLNACSKSNEVLTVTRDNLVGTYTIISITASAPNTPTQDVTKNTLAPCQLDDQIILRSDYTAIKVDAGMKCTTDDGFTDTWDLNGNIITVAGDDFTITSLTRSTLVLQQVTNVSGFVVTSTFTYRKN